MWMEGTDADSVVSLFVDDRLLKYGIKYFVFFIRDYLK